MQKLYNKTRHLPVNVRSANRQIGKLKMEWITNFKSLKFMSELLFAAYKYVLTKELQPTRKEATKSAYLATKTQR